eukprot:CAMPEP_0119070630 /NCGR_PEP_ID=MMETSP1178-20130426/42852_1 /TAXON_ID=33656 /ORGANISM="unid sp, Strain CCMP2000" /LENGTH=139 /DNA_ID=CAMNT_0007052483 /DNA_START=89 /DNA_END=508 /DNA_ORIENTATION=+
MTMVPMPSATGMQMGMQMGMHFPAMAGGTATMQAPMQPSRMQPIQAPMQPMHAPMLPMQAPMQPMQAQAPQAPLRPLKFVGMSGDGQPVFQQLTNSSPVFDVLPTSTGGLAQMTQHGMLQLPYVILPMPPMGRSVLISA